MVCKARDHPATVGLIRPILNLCEKGTRRNGYNHPKN